MASSRSGLKGHDISSVPAQSKRSGAYMEASSGDFPSPLSRRARKAAESARLASMEVPQTRTTSKILQTPSRRAPPQTHKTRPSLGPRGPSWSSNVSNGSEQASTSAISSSSATSSRSQESSKRPRNLLRRKHSEVTQDPPSVRYHSRNSSMRTDSSSSVPQSQASLGASRDGKVDRGLTESPAEIRVAQRVELPTTSAQAVTVYPELDRYRDFRPQTTPNRHYVEVPYPISTDLPPPTPLFSGGSSQHSTFSGSPSTRFSGSPGPGPYSRDTTPTSISSQSPGIVASIRAPALRSKQSSPADTRPPVTRRRAGSTSKESRDVSTDPDGLSVVRESLNSFSSNSTVRDATVRDRKKKRLSPLAPSPPPRESSENFSKSRLVTETPSMPVREPAKPLAPVSSSSRIASSTRPAQELSQAPQPRAAAPVRPSRDGTPDLQNQFGLPLPIVHSNLSSTSFSERGRSNSNLAGTLVRSESTTPLPIGRQQQSSALRVGREPTPAPHVGASASDSQLVKQDARKATRTPSPSVSSTFKTRFPLFGRRNKTASNAPPTVTEKKDRPPRKGPAAGTGHEGYGRLGQVRRRTSSVAGTLRAVPGGTMSSQESLASSQSIDPFLAERMSPVVIAGGEIVENRNAGSDLSRTESDQSLVLPRPSFGSKNNSQASLSSQGNRNTLWPSALPRGATSTPSRGHPQEPRDSSDSEDLTMKPTLAFRRSIQRLKMSDEATMRLPKPIVVPSGVTTPSVNSHDTTLLSDDSLYDPPTRQIPARNDTGNLAPKKLTKKAKLPRKWNLFGRSTSQPVSTEKQSETQPMAAAVKVVQQKPVAFYTIMDSSGQEDEGQTDVKDVLREAQVSRAPSPPIPVPIRSERRPSHSRYQSQETENKSIPARKPEMTQVSRSIPAVAASREPRNPLAQPSRMPQPSATSKATSARPSRLPQVGRIPKVITARPEPLSPRSFSRPFKRASLQLRGPVNVEVLCNDTIAKGQSPPQLSWPAPEQSQESAMDTKAENESTSTFRVSRELPSEASRSQDEFLSFPLRKGSQGTSTTASSCSGLPSFSDATAVIPEANDPLAEDEIWDEYNDLIGDEALRVPPSAGSSQGKPFHLEIWGRHLAKEKNQTIESPTVVVNDESECETEFDTEAQVEPERITSNIYGSSMTAKINEVLEAAGAPKSPFSARGFVSGYGDRNNSVDTSQSQIQNQRASNSSSEKARVVRESYVSGSSQGSEDNSAVSQVNLRVGSMTVSKWLTFGHVLFSPVRDELVPMVGSLKRHSILVIDGLGNDDWSFYAAETYPAATFFNLSPRAPLPTENQSSPSSFPLSPPNHHQIQYRSHIEKFPFGPQSFTSVVYRFPAAAPESHYRHVITEARRVLKPGGYIELAILDVDMNNMGNHARRAVRRVKERIHIRSPDTSLGSSSDLILRLMGRKGFTDIKTCRVGVPVASAIAPSPSGGLESSSSISSGTGGTGSTAGRSGATRRNGKRDTRNLAEMVSDEGPVADESITKMVAKVGRWWYGQCYESVGMGSGSSKSMWTDQALLTECEEWRTSFKLMVCHARVPDGRSRVASI